MDGTQGAVACLFLSSSVTSFVVKFSDNFKVIEVPMSRFIRDNALSILAIATLVPESI